MNRKNKLALLVIPASTVLAVSAQAAVPPEVTTAVTDFIADIALYGALFIGLTAAVLGAETGITWLKKFVKKAR